MQGNKPYYWIKVGKAWELRQERYRAALKRGSENPKDLLALSFFDWDKAGKERTLNVVGKTKIVEEI